MSPEFIAILGERKQLGLWFILLPICLGFLNLIVSKTKNRKGSALILITLLAVASVVIPTLMTGFWWTELSDAATTHEDKMWILDHDGGLIIAPAFATLIATVFWIIAVLRLTTRIVIARIRKTKEKKEKYLESKESP